MVTLGDRILLKLRQIVGKARLAILAVRIFENPLTFFRLLRHRGTGRRVLRMRGGTKLVLRENIWDARIVREIFLQRPYLKYIDLPDYPTIVDVGSYIGDFAVFAASYLHAQVVAYEPTAENFELLEENIRINRFHDAITAVNMAVGTSDEITLHVQKKQQEIHASSCFHRDAPRRNVPSRTLQQVLNVHRLKQIDLLKVDCEECEYEVLANVPESAYRRILNVVVRCHEVGRYREQLPTLTKHLEDADYTVHTRHRMLYASRRRDIESEVEVLAWPAVHNTNPYCKQLTHALRALGVRVHQFERLSQASREHDILHIHWPDAVLNYRNRLKLIWKAGRLLLTVAVARSRGASLVWTAHNIRSHERFHPWLEASFWRLFIGRVDGVIALSKTAEDAAIKEYPRLARIPHFVIRHGHYRDVLPCSSDKLSARDLLGLPRLGSIILFFGRVRRYKNVPHLLQAFVDVEENDVRLIVAGKANLEPLTQEIARLAQRDHRIDLRLNHVPDRELCLLIRAADLVVLPFASVLNSGSVILALSCDRPVLTSDIGSLHELKMEIGPDWIRTYKADLKTQDLREALRWSHERTASIAPLHALDWDQIGLATLHAYRTVISKKNQPESP